MSEIDLDALIDESVVYGELSAGTRGAWLTHRADPRLVAVLGNMHQARERKSPAWSEEEDRFLREHLTHMTDAEIGARLGRTSEAVHLRRERDLRLTPRSKDEDWPTLQQVAYIMGVPCQKTVASWVNAGLIPARAISTAQRDIRAIARETLIRWAVNPENWIYFKPERIADPYLRRLVELRRQRWPDAWWTPAQAGAYHGVTHMAINNRINAGTLPAKRWGNWWIKRSDAVALRITPGKGKHQPGVTTDAGDAFVVLARALGFAHLTISQLCGWSEARIEWRLKMLHERGEIAPLIARVDLAAQYDPATGDLFADWRDFPHRFPRLEAAHRRFLAGSVNDRDINYMAYTLTTWARWHAGNDEQRHLAYRICHANKTVATLTRFWAELKSWGIEPL